MQCSLCKKDYKLTEIMGFFHENKDCTSPVCNYCFKKFIADNPGCRFSLNTNCKDIKIDYYPKRTFFQQLKLVFLKIKRDFFENKD